MEKTKNGRVTAKNIRSIISTRRIRNTKRIRRRRNIDTIKTEVELKQILMMKL